MDIKLNTHLIIYGSGYTGAHLFEKLKKLGLDKRVKAFLDTSKELHQKKCCGIKICDPEILINESNYTVIISVITAEFIDEIKKTLNNLGVKKENIILHSAFDENKAYNNDELLRLDKIKDKLFYGKEIFQKVIDARQSRNWEGVKRYNSNRKINLIDEYLKGFNFTDYINIFDCGTFDGFHAHLFHKLNEKANIYSFDPLGDKLVKRTYINKKIFYIKAAFLDKKSKMYFREMPTYLGGANYLSENRQSGDSYLVETTTIDDWVKENDITSISYIKTDIEGSDYMALKGATNSISKFLPDLAISIYHKNDHMYLIPEFVKSINPEYNLWFDHYTDSLDSSVLYCSTSLPSKKFLV